jgi:hypothetical protein
VGSTCIESTVPWLLAHGADDVARRLEGALEAHQRALAEAKRRERDAAQSVQVQEMLVDWEALYAWRRTAVESCRTRRAHVPAWIYQSFGKPKACSTPGRTAASLAQKYASAWLSSHRAHEEASYLARPPAPRAERLRGALSKELEREIMRAERRRTWNIEGERERAEDALRRFQTLLDEIRAS